MNTGFQTNEDHLGIFHSLFKHDLKWKINKEERISFYGTFEVQCQRVIVKPITFRNPHLILHWTHPGFDESDACLHGEDHERAGHDPGRVIVLKLLAEHGHDVENRADVFLFIADNPVIAFGCRNKTDFLSE